MISLGYSPTNRPFKYVINDGGTRYALPLGHEELTLWQIETNLRNGDYVSYLLPGPAYAEKTAL